MEPPGDVLEVLARFGDTIIDASHVGGDRGYRIGNAPGVELAVGDALGASFPLIESRGGGFVFHRTAGIHGWLTVDGRATPLEELGEPSRTVASAFEIAIPRHAQIRARIGRVDFVIRRGAPAARLALAPPFRDRRVLSYLAVSVAAHLLLSLVVNLVANDDADHLELASAEDLRVNSDPFYGVEVTSWDRDRSPDDRLHGSGAPLAHAAGAAGSTTSSKRTGHIQIERRHDEPRVTRAQETDRAGSGRSAVEDPTARSSIEGARNAGILESTAMTPETFTALAGSKELSSGFDDHEVHAPLSGGTGEASGGFGLARTGVLPGAGCDGGPCGTIGVGRYGTHSNGQTRGTGWGGQLWSRAHVTQSPTVILCGPGCLVSDHGVDKEIIRRYIRRQLERITYCYEKELIARPDASGEVAIDFLIAADGAVPVASGQGDPAIASCVVAVIKGIEFPRARTREITRVHYPFTFRRAGR